MRIETYNNQCTISELFEFIEDSLFIRGCVKPMYWINERELRLCKKNKHIFLAIHNEKMVGCVIVKKDAAYATMMIEILCIRKRYRNRGYGKKLIEHVEGLFLNDGLCKYIRTDSWGPFKAKQFYESLGFTKEYRSFNIDETWHLEKKIR